MWGCALTNLSVTNNFMHKKTTHEERLDKVVSQLVSSAHWHLRLSARRSKNPKNAEIRNAVRNKH